MIGMKVKSIKMDGWILTTTESTKPNAEILKLIQDAGLIDYVDLSNFEPEWMSLCPNFGIPNVRCSGRVRKRVDRSDWSWSSKLK